MSKRSWGVASVCIICGWLVSQVNSPLWGQQDAKPVIANPAEAAQQEKELDIRVAEAYLNLMEATLRKYEDTNRRAPNTIRPTIIQGVQDAVRKARERVQLAQGDDINDSQIYVSSAEGDLRLAEDALSKAEAANRRLSGAISQGEVDRLRAQRDLAKVKIEKAKHLAAESPLSNVRFELEQLREEVQELRLFVALLRFRN
ncbi:MAG TPA: hypothetical protein VGN12_03045 [Pirellulales bacterium]|jgi:hypothetical protein